MKRYIKIDSGFATGNYADAVHGPRRLLVPDPDWVRPLITVTLQPGQSVQAVDADGNPVSVANDTDQPMLVDRVPDQQAVAPLIDGGPNPATKIPADAVEITEDQYRELLDNQGRRKVQVIGGEVQISEYAPPPPPLEQLKSIKSAKINTERDSQVNQPVSAIGHIWDADERSRQLLTSTLAAVQAGVTLPPSFAWTTADNIDVPVSVQDLSAIAAAMVSQGYAAHTTARARKTVLAAATTAPEIDSI